MANITVFDLCFGVALSLLVLYSQWIFLISTPLVYTNYMGKKSSNFSYSYISLKLYIFSQ